MNFSTRKHSMELIWRTVEVPAVTAPLSRKVRRLRYRLDSEPTIGIRARVQQCHCARLLTGDAGLVKGCVGRRIGETKTLVSFSEFRIGAGPQLRLVRLQSESRPNPQRNLDCS